MQHYAAARRGCRRSDKTSLFDPRYRPGVAVDRTGQLVGNRFRIDGPVGRGAMAHVWRAHDHDTGADIALKILRSELRDPSAVARFAREGDVQARIAHNNVAKLIATGVTSAGEPYLAVELLRGTTLRAVMKASGPVAPANAASYMWQALQGLTAVHAAGVLHRDLKPANIMLEPSPGPVQRVVLIDFGFASLEGGAKLTGPLMVVGSLRYIAPERLRDEPPDQRADVYAIGAIFYELIAGTPPFADSDEMRLVDAHLQREPPTSSAIPSALSAVIMRALAKAPADRFADAGAMALAIELAVRRLPA